MHRSCFNLTQFNRGILPFVASATTETAALAAAVGDVSQRSLYRGGISSERSLGLLRRIRTSPSTVKQGVRNQSTLSTNQSPYLLYSNSNSDDRARFLTESGMRMLGVSSRDIPRGWQELQKRIRNSPGYHPRDDLCDYNSNNSKENVISLIRIIPSYNNEIQAQPIIEDINEALLFELFVQSPNEAVKIPFDRDSTPDSLEGLKLLTGILQPNDFIFEDGCDNGQHLVQMIKELHDNNIPVKAIGTDLAFYNTVVAQMLATTFGMEGECRFFTAHALHRFSPRSFSKSAGRHVLLAYRMIPVFDEKKIMRYMDRISADLKPGDLWCGSIALPSGRFYEKHTTDRHWIDSLQVRRISTAFGAETFVHKPSLGATNQQMLKYFSASYGFAGFRCTVDDFDNVLLNTYMTGNQFEILAKKFDFSFAVAPVKVQCSDNDRLVVILEKQQ